MLDQFMNQSFLLLDDELMYIEDLNNFTCPFNIY